MSAHADARAGELAQRQAGCVSRAQALEVGLSDDMIRHRVRSHRWRRVRPGVYVLAGVPPSWLQEVWVAVLAVGPQGTVTHETALLVHGATAVRVPRRPVTLTVPHGQHHRIDGAVVHQIDDLRGRHVTEVAGLPVSRPERAVVEVSASMGERRLGVLLDELVAGRLTTLAGVGVCLADVARPGKRGVVRLARVLQERGPGFVPPQSELERRLLAALASGGLPPPVRQLRLPGRGAVEGFADAGYRDARMLIEADGRRWHTRVEDLRRDHLRDAEASRAGWVTLRFLYEEIVATPGQVADTVAEVRRTRLAQLGVPAA